MPLELEGARVSVHVLMPAADVRAILLTPFHYLPVYDTIVVVHGLLLQSG